MAISEFGDISGGGLAGYNCMFICPNSKSPVVKTADATFKWDADKDEDKRVGVKASVGGGETLRGDLTISMPSLRKVNSCF